MRRVPTSPTGEVGPERFTGQAWVDSIWAGPPPSRLRVALVHFAPGAHTAWHRHALGQTLHVTQGLGVVGTRDGQVFVLSAGETVNTPPGEWHWHGALPDHFMTHLAAGETLGDPQLADVEWAQHLTDAEYEDAIRQAVGTPDGHRPEGAPASSPNNTGGTNE